MYAYILNFFQLYFALFIDYPFFILHTNMQMLVFIYIVHVLYFLCQLIEAMNRFIRLWVWELQRVSWVIQFKQSRKPTTPLFISLNTFQHVNKDHQQWFIFLVVNSGTTDLVSKLGTNGLVKRQKFIEFAHTKLVSVWKTAMWLSFYIHRSYVQSHTFWHNLLILYFSVIFLYMKSSFVPSPWYKLHVPDFTTRDC